MYFETAEHLGTSERDLLATGDDGNELLLINDFRGLFRDEASIRKMKEPLYGNGHLRCDAPMQQIFLELAWYYDPTSLEETPCWDRYALQKMREPVVGFTHYRITPKTMPILFELAWFHDGLLEALA